MARRCSHCSNNGHNLRTCPSRGVKIFGVRLTDGSIRKSASMGSLAHYTGSTGGSSPDHGGGRAADGYASEDFVQGSSSCRDRKKGVPWTEEEHRMFLLGLKKLGKGDWRGIARNYVVSRTPTQVASHAQKYFIRQANASRRKRRTSLFDMVPDEPADAPVFPVGSQESETQGNNPLPAPPALDEECESMDSNSNDGEGVVPKPETWKCGYPLLYPNDGEVVPRPETLKCSYSLLYPTFVAPLFPFYPFWPGYHAEAVENKEHEIVKPTAIHPKVPINVDELGGMCNLSLGVSAADTSSSFLSLKQPDGSDRQSAFHAKPQNGSRVNSSTNAIPCSFFLNS